MAQLPVTQGEGLDKANGRAEYVYAAVIAAGLAVHAFDRFRPRRRRPAIVG